MSKVDLTKLDRAELAEKLRELPVADWNAAVREARSSANLWGADLRGEEERIELNGKHIAVGPIGGFVSLVGSVLWRFKCKRFLRIAEPGEVVPKGAATKSIAQAMSGDDLPDFSFAGTLSFPQVVISVPPKVESERGRKMRELGEQIERLQAKYDDLAGVGE